MTKEEAWTKEIKQIFTVSMRDIKQAKEKLKMLDQKKKILQDKPTDVERYPISTNIEYLLSTYDYTKNNHWFAKATGTKAKKLLFNSGYTDFRQLEGKNLADFLELCEGTKVLALILAYCYKCNVNVKFESSDYQKNLRIKSIKEEAFIFNEYISV